jgi:hypothetical protein
MERPFETTNEHELTPILNRRVKMSPFSMREIASGDKSAVPRRWAHSEI